MEALLFQTSPVSSTPEQGDLEPLLFPTVHRLACGAVQGHSSAQPQIGSLGDFVAGDLVTATTVGLCQVGHPGITFFALTGADAMRTNALQRCFHRYA